MPKTKKYNFKSGPAHRTIYENGATFIFQRVHNLHTSCFYLWFNVGPHLETESNQGLCHLIEHMVFKTKNEHGQRFVELIESCGGEVNAHTSKEYICFELSCFKKNIFQTLPLFMEMIFSADFKEEDLKNEKNVIIQEINEDSDDLELFAEETAFKKYFDFPLGHNIAGTRKSVKSLKRSDILKFYKKHFTANKMIATIVADVDSKKITTLFSESLKRHTDNKKNKPSRPRMVVNKWAHRKFKTTIKRQSQLSYFVLMKPGVSLTHRERYNLIVLDLILNDGMSSVLFRKLRELGLIYSLSSAVYSFTTNGCYSMSLGCEKKNIKKILKIIDETFIDVSKHGVDESKIETTKLRLLEHWYMNLDDVGERTSYLTRSEFYRGELHPLSFHEKSLRSVSAKSLKKFAKEFIKHPFSHMIIESL